MTNKRSFYFIPVAFFAVLGLFTSLVHYHSEGLECLDHAEEAHLVQTEDFCPVSTLVTDDDFSTPFTFDILLSSEDEIIQYYSEEEIDSFIASKSGRSPPSMA